MKGTMKALVMGLAVGAMTMGLVGVSGAAITSDKGAYVSGRYAIQLDGVNAGWITNTVGGDAVASVAIEKLGTTGAYPKKHATGVQYTDITLESGVGMSRAFYEWIKASVAMPGTSRKSGAIVATDFNFQEQSRLTFRNALLSQIEMPALDAASKDPAHIHLALAPELTQRTTAPVAGGKQSPSGSKVKA